MASDQRKYLDEHLTYELLMLRYCYREMPKTAHPLHWNALFEAFVVHARNWYDFLRSEDDTRNFKASDFNAAYQPKRLDKISGAFDRLHRHSIAVSRHRRSRREPECQ